MREWTSTLWEMETIPWHGGLASCPALSGGNEYYCCHNSQSNEEKYTHSLGSHSSSDSFHFSGSSNPPYKGPHSLQFGFSICNSSNIWSRAAVRVQWYHMHLKAPKLASPLLNKMSPQVTCLDVSCLIVKHLSKRLLLVSVCISLWTSTKPRCFLFHHNSCHIWTPAMGMTL